MEVNKKRLSEIFGVSVRTIQNWQDQGMPVARGGGKGNEVLYESSAAIEWYSARDAAIENEKLRKEVEDLRLASVSMFSCGAIRRNHFRLPRLAVILRCGALRQTACSASPKVKRWKPYQPPLNRRLHHELKQ